MTPAHRVETILTEDGKLSLERLPFQAGQPVEVLVVPRSSPRADSPSLRGAVVRYDRPTEPVAAADWDAMQ